MLANGGGFASYGSGRALNSRRRADKMTILSGHFWCAAMADLPEEIPAAAFKAACLKLMDRVEHTRAPIIITKHGRPVAQLAPVPVSPRSLFGYMQNSVRTVGDITAPLDIEWHAPSGAEDPLYGRAPPPRRRRPRRK
jgi:prevent-host-death family protein